MKGVNMDSYRQRLYNLIDGYLAQSSDLGRDNANFVKSISIVEVLIKSQVNKNYLFDNIYKGLPIRNLHKGGFIYHHQTSSGLAPYCIGLSSYDIVLKGLRSNASNERRAAPPKRIESLLNQAANLICLLAQEVSGATSMNDLSTTLAGYLYILETKKGQKFTLKDIENCWQSFLYNVNLPFRSGNSPFSNVTLDFGEPAAGLAGKLVCCGGKVYDMAYKDVPEEYYDRINEAFIEAMDCGDADGQPFTFPLITVNITDDFDFQNHAWKMLLEKSEGFGGFYIQNYCTKPFDDEARKVNPYHIAYDRSLLYSNCCRMLFDLKELMTVTGNNPYAASGGVGGINVIAINLNRLLWLTQGDEELLFPMCDLLADACAEALQIKRMWLRKYWKQLFPYLSYYVPSDETLFSIISVLGAHEGFMSCGYKKGIFEPEAKELAHKLGRFFNEKMKELSRQYTVPFTLEFAPSESAAATLAEQDLEFAQDLMDSVYEEKEFPSFTPKLDEYIQLCVTKNKDKLFKPDSNLVSNKDRGGNCKCNQQSV